MLSLPENTVTPAARNRATGGNGWLPGAFVMIATPDAAITSAAPAGHVGRNLAEAVAWLTATRPCMPSARVRAAICSIWKTPSMCGSCRWISTPTSRRSAMEKTTSSLPLDVAVDGGRIEAADQVAAHRDGLVEQLGGAGAGQDAVLGKGDQLDVDQVAVASRTGRIASRCFRPTAASTFDVAAHAQRSRCKAEIDLRAAR